MRTKEKFDCWWCERTLGPRKRHHDQWSPAGTRPCCSTCHADPDGVYRRVYPGGESQEREEVLRACNVPMEGL